MIFLALMFALAATVWMIPVIRCGRITPLATMVLLVGTVLGPAFFAIDGPVQVSLDRVLWLAMFAVVAVRWRMGQLSIDRLNRVDWLVIGLAVWLLISAQRGGPVPGGGSPTARWLFYIAMPIGMYVVSRLIVLTDRDVRWFLRAALALGVYLAVTAVFEVTGIHWLVFPTHIVDSTAWEFYGRGRGPLLNPAGNGILMSLALSIAILGALVSGRRGKVLFGLLGIVILGGIAATLTRSAWLGSGAAIGVMAMVFAPRWLRVLGLAGVMLFGGAMALGLKDQLIRLKRDKHLTAADAEKSLQLRPLLAVVAWEMFKDRPIVGHGFGHYFEHAGPYHEARRYGLPLENARPYGQHNVLLSMLVDAGLIGFTLLSAWFLTLMAIGWKLARDRGSPFESRAVGIALLCFLAAYLSNGMFQDVLIIPMVHMFLFFLGGVAVTIYARGLAVRSTRPVPISAVRPVIATSV